MLTVTLYLNPSISFILKRYGLTTVTAVLEPLPTVGVLVSAPPAKQLHQSIKFLPTPISMQVYSRLRYWEMQNLLVMV